VAVGVAVWQKSGGLRNRGREEAEGTGPKRLESGAALSGILSALECRHRVQR
jgi:hypothetical protein